jgi:hypothetical protein
LLNAKRHWWGWKVMGFVRLFLKIRNNKFEIRNIRLCGLQGC